jgi:hypothetical protein
MPNAVNSRWEIARRVTEVARGVGSSHPLQQNDVKTSGLPCVPRNVKSCPDESSQVRRKVCQQPPAAPRGQYRHPTSFLGLSSADLHWLPWQQWDSDWCGGVSLSCLKNTPASGVTCRWPRPTLTTPHIRNRDNAKLSRTVMLTTNPRTEHDKFLSSDEPSSTGAERHKVQSACWSGQ